MFYYTDGFFSKNVNRYNINPVYNYILASVLKLTQRNYSILGHNLSKYQQVQNNSKSNLALCSVITGISTYVISLTEISFVLLDSNKIATTTQQRKVCPHFRFERKATSRLGAP